MRRRTVLAAAAAVLTAGLTGCGIPDETEVRDIGPGPERESATSVGAGLGPPAPDAATEKEKFVANFLAAGAGQADKAQDRIRQYITESARDKVKADKEAGINVVRLRGDPAFTDAGEGSWKVTIKVDQVGVLDTYGRVGVPDPDLKASSYEFTIAGYEGRNTWRVTDPPAHLLLSTDALGTYYEPHTIYFWSKDRKTLVPDGRYMPNDLDVGQRPTQVVKWLIGGPSDWLAPTVSKLNAGTQSKANIPYPKDQLEVSFNAVVAEQTDDTRGLDVVPQLGQQLMWSLRPYLNSKLVLRIDGQKEQTFTKDDAFYSANAANRSAEGREPEEDDPERFAIYQGKIYRLSGSPQGGTQPLPRLLLAEGVNKDIASAALAREDTGKGVLTGAALVTPQQGGGRKLRVVTALGDGAHVPFTSKAFEEMTRAVWLKRPMDVGLVVADKHLYQFTTENGTLERVSVSGFDGKIDDVSAAPDGRRIAILSGGEVYVLGISRSGSKVQAEEPERRVSTPLRSRSLSAVDWSEETKVVVAGAGLDGKPEVWEVGIDGGIAEIQQVGDPGGPVEHLVAYPDDPLVTSPTKVMFSRQGAAFDVDGGKEVIEAAEVIGAPGEVVPTQVTAPFFLLD